MKSLLRLLRLIGINAGVLFILLLIMEVYLRFLGKDYGNSPADADPVVNYVHPANYYYKMFTPSGEFGGYSIYFDSLRRRAQVPELAIHRPGTAPNIVFLGDSFTEALQVPYDSSFIGILSTRFPQAAFLNYGVTGYGTILYYLQCKKMLNEHGIRPAAVFMILYSNDVRDDSTVLNRAILDANRNEIIAIDGGRKNSLVAWLRKFYLVRTVNKFFLQWKFTQKAKKESDTKGVLINNLLEEAPALENSVSAQYILKTDSLLKTRNIPLYITAIPSRYKNFTGDLSRELFAEKTEAWCMTNNLPYINLQAAFDSTYRQKPLNFFYSKDVHCNANGHKVIASVFSKIVGKFIQ